jgi:hypothetical protein
MAAGKGNERSAYERTAGQSYMPMQPNRRQATALSAAKAARMDRGKAKGWRCAKLRDEPGPKESLLRKMAAKN